ncbi:MAG: hypothetical protein COU22_02135 [Candidatus Komeilibacteria bacterium CG10_big_fil_rev_8_21_14_0_10_41_13]|uniref:Uncharacterized protein n=1 Tax=Candidatus Komeilibacteria bacterium CG10_big_fil_rev_8_21_14_0_10_41_13 TaxID=1974476 RepID=A0A2M6WCC6_9BACT|nr:MAG: hypothetical protein COU22_02135 [Candidatus Komeilibacteria bacterium CG10_big_fil_rev_8_21_14_0_10_41_13]
MSDQPFDFVSASGKIHEVLKALQNYVADHGGNPKHVARLLNPQDLKKLGPEIAKVLVGDIWNFVGKENAVDLEIDWTIPVDELPDLFPDIRLDNAIHTAQLVDGTGCLFTDKQPLYQCSYALFCNDEMTNLRTLLNHFYLPGGHAGYRELLYFVNQPQLASWTGFPRHRVLALGSIGKYNKQKPKRSFPRLEHNNHNGNIERFIEARDLISGALFAPGTFFLVRIPKKS